MKLSTMSILGLALTASAAPTVKEGRYNVNLTCLLRPKADIVLTSTRDIHLYITTNEHPIKPLCLPDGGKFAFAFIFLEPSAISGVYISPRLPNLGSLTIFIAICKADEDCCSGECRLFVLDHICLGKAY